MRIGLREANQQFSKAMKTVKAGGEVVLTERGKPIAVIRRLEKSEKCETAIRRLEAAGLLRPASKCRPLPPWTALPVRGTPFSRTIREDRDKS